MTRQTTPSGFPYYVGSDKPAGHLQQQDLAETLEAVSAKFDAGGLVLAGGRQGQPLPEPGRRGRFYRDTGAGQRGALWVDTETEWHPLATIPIGGTLDWPWGTAPPGPATWLEQLGQSIAKAAFPELFAAVGVSAATMNLPNRRGRASVGAGDATAQTSARAVGEAFGSESVGLTVAQMPSHAHSINDPGHQHGTPVVYWQFTNDGGAPGRVPGAGLFGAIPNSDQSAVGHTGIQVQSNGGGSAHPNTQPSFVTRYFTRVR